MISYLSGNLLPLFFLLAAINFIYSVYILIHGYITIISWNPKIDNLNRTSDTLSDEEVDQFEEEAVGSKLINNLIKKIKSITSKSSDLSVNEIHGVIDDDIMYWEDNLSNSANIFIMLGVMFTVLGLFFALPQKIDIGSTKKLLENFGVAFQTTIYGLTFASLTKASQFYIGKKRKIFRYNFVLLAKTILVPRYSIPEADEKNLSQLTRILSRSASELERAAISVNQLASDTTIGTENIEKAVGGFSEVIEKLSQREDSLLKSLGNLSNYLTVLSSSIEDTIKPLTDRILNELKDNNINSALSIKSIKNVHDQQVDLNKSVKKAIEDISKSNEKLGSFFGDEFEDVFKKTLDELKDTYNEELNSIAKGIENINKEIDNKLNNDLFKKNISELIDEMDNQFTKIEEKIVSINGPVNDLRVVVGNVALTTEENNELISDIHDSSKSLNNNISEIHKTVFDIQSNINNADIDNINSSLEETSDSLKDLKSLIDEVQKELSFISTKLKELPDDKSGLWVGFKKIFSED